MGLEIGFGIGAMIVFFGLVHVLAQYRRHDLDVLAQYRRHDLDKEPKL